MLVGSRRCLSLWVLLLTAALTGSGCHVLPHHEELENDIPRELEKTLHPDYVLEPPDIVLIDALRLSPKPPYKIDPLDTLQITVAGMLAEPIGGLYVVDPDGTVKLGATYGSVPVEGLTLVEAKKAIETFLKKPPAGIKEPNVQVSLAQSRALQQVRGEHLIQADGTVVLGVYGSVRIAGMTLQEAKLAIEAHLSQFVRKPEVSVDIFTYNSKVYYVITDGGGAGEQVHKFAVTGNETVLDAISQINGLPPVASRKHIWLARPAADHESEEILDVDWKAITRRGSAKTNYQVFAGDRIYVQSDPLVRIDTFLARVISPIERLFGVTLLGSSTISGLKQASGPTQNGGGGN